MRSDLNKFTFNDEPSQINYNEVRKLMDEEDFEYG